MVDNWREEEANRGLRAGLQTEYVTGTRVSVDNDCLCMVTGLKW